MQMICEHSVRERPDCIVRGLLELKKHNLLRQDLITLVCSHRYPAHIISAMALMQENNLLYDDLLVEILQQEYPIQYLHKIIFLKKNQVLEHNHIIQANRFAILSNDNAIGILEMLLYISNTTELTDNIVKSIMAIANQIPLEYFAKNFKKIMGSGLKSENIAAVIDIFTTLTTRLFFDSVTNALCTLSYFNLITVDNLKIFTHAIANRKVQLIYCLDDDWVEKYHLKKLLTGPLAQKNYMTLANADCPKPTSIELIILDDAGLLSENGDDQKYREILMHSYPDNKANVIIQLERLNLMSATIAQELRLTVNPLEVLEKAKILQTRNAEDEYIALSFS